MKKFREIDFISFEEFLFFLIFWLIVKIWWMFFRITPSFAWHFWWNMNGHLKLFFFVKIICIWKCKQKADVEFFHLFFRIVRIPSCRNPWCSQCFAWYSAWRSFKGMLRIFFIFFYFWKKIFVKNRNIIQFHVLFITNQKTKMMIVLQNNTIFRLNNVNLNF